MDSYRTMQSMRLIGVVLVAAMWVGFHSSTAHADVTVWSTSATACVPVNTSGLSVTPVAVTAAAGVTVTLNCAITTKPGDFNSIEITYMGGGFVLPPLARAQSSTRQTSTEDVNAIAAVILRGGIVTSELVETSKATGAETISKCGIQSKGSSTITTEVNLCQGSSIIDFNKNFYSLRIVLKSGITTGSQMTVYGSSLVIH
jgi:hypothetical protein